VLRERVGAAEAIGAVQETQRRGARQLFAAQAQLLLDLGPADPAARDDAFLATQEALASRAGEALRRAAVRRSAGTGALPRLLRTQLEAQDAQRQAEAQVLATAIRPASAEATRSAAARRDAAAARFADATAALARDFPDFAGFIAPRPASLEQVQRTLEPDEALLAPLATEDGLLVWVVRRNALRALKDPMRADELAAHVQTLRSGLDVGLGQDIAPFSFLSAQAVHAALLGRAEEVGLLEGVRHLLLIPDGALQQLPPHVLVDAAGSWLVERHAVTIAPSVAAILRPGAFGCAVRLSRHRRPRVQRLRHASPTGKPRPVARSAQPPRGPQPPSGYRGRVAAHRAHPRRAG
jgi:CHAT domain-containing protein